MFLGTFLFFRLGKIVFRLGKIVWLLFPAFASAAVASLLLGFVGEGGWRVLRLGGFVVGSAGHDEI